MSKTKLVTISLTFDQQEDARRLSKDLFGKEGDCIAGSAEIVLGTYYNGD